MAVTPVTVSASVIDFHLQGQQNKKYIMITQMSSDELHQFKTAMLAENPVVKVLQRTSSDREKDVNYVRHLNGFFSLVRNDNRLRAHHISLYLALFQIWNSCQFRKQFPVNRQWAMQLSKIGSANTYTESIKWLHQCGYIIYRPSGRRYIPCQVSIVINTGVRIPDIKSDTNTGPENDTQRGINNATRTVANLRHNFNNKQINSKGWGKQGPVPQKNNFNEKEIPTLETTIQWFSQGGQTTQEARKFYYHYQAINWTISGQPIRDWEAAAIKWIEKAKTINHDKPGKLHVDANKSFSEPL